MTAPAEGSDDSVGRIETEVAELRESKSRPDAGIVTFLHRAYNQDDVLVASCRRSGLQRKRPA